MTVNHRHVEELVHCLVGKPLAWALYGFALILVFVTMATVRGIQWATRKASPPPRNA